MHIPQRIRSANARAVELADSGQFENCEAVLKHMLEVEHNAAATAALADPLGQQMITARCVSARRIS